MIIYGTANNDVIYADGYTTNVYAGKGNDTIEVNSLFDPVINNLRVNGGEGDDEFRFRMREGYTFDIDEVSSSKTVITFFDETETQVQRVVLNDVEDISFWMIA